MLAPEEETDAEVRREDQDRINQFARLNARAGELHAERNVLKKQLEGLDDASTELMMCSDESDDTVMVFQGGETFFDCTVDETVGYIERKTEVLQKQLDESTTQLTSIQSQQDKLKRELYARFGKSINLEEAAEPAL